MRRIHQIVINDVARPDVASPDDTPARLARPDDTPARLPALDNITSCDNMAASTDAVR